MPRNRRGKKPHQGFELPEDFEFPENFELPEGFEFPENFDDSFDVDDLLTKALLLMHLQQLDQDQDFDIIDNKNAFNYYLNYDSSIDDQSSTSFYTEESYSSSDHSSDETEEQSENEVDRPELITFRTVNLRQINRDIRDFVCNSIDPILSFPPMEQCVRHQVEMIGEMYRLECETKGTARSRYLEFTKTSKSKKPHDTKLLDRLVNASLQHSSKAPKGRETSKKHAKKHPKESLPIEEVKTNVPKDGSVVGHDAPSIDTDNVGNKLLRKMGWTPGQSLGSGNTGIKEPVNASVKRTKKGIGF